MVQKKIFVKNSQQNSENMNVSMDLIRWERL